jgi:hypothetical protein
VAWTLALLIVNGLAIAGALLARKNAREGFRLARLALVCATLLVATSVVLAGIGVHRASVAASAGAIDPTEKARILAEGISEAMNCAAFAVLALLVPGVVSFVLYRRATKELAAQAAS